MRRVIEKISLDYREQPSLETLAEEVGETPTGLQKLFTRWAGLSSKGLPAGGDARATRANCSTAACRCLRLPTRSACPALAACTISSSRMRRCRPATTRSRGAGLTIRYGYHISPFGVALVMVTDRGLAGLSFNDPGEERAAFADMSGRWPNANYVEDMSATAPYAARIFDPARWRADQPLKVVHDRHRLSGAGVAGAPQDPHGRRARNSMRSPARSATPAASRAVGAAVGANPISFVVPCHRALGKSRSADRLPLGPHPQARDPGLGGGADSPLRKPSAPPRR